MIKSYFTLSLALVFITQCLAAYKPVQGTQSMDMVGSGSTASWIAELNLSDRYADTITFSELLEVANMGWNWLRMQPNAWTQDKNCLTSALWVPGGKVFIGSIARGERLTQMKANGPTLAPVWWKAKTGTGNHAEDNVLYQFESRQTETDGQDGNGLLMVTYGSFSGKADTVGEPVNPCSKCKITAKGLEVNYFDKNLVGLVEEPDNVAKRSPKKGKAPKKVTTSTKTTSSSKTASSVTTSSSKTTSAVIVHTTSTTSKTSSSQISSASQTSSTGHTSSSSQTSSSRSTSDGPKTLSTVTTSAQSGSTIAEPTIKAVSFTYSLSDQTAVDKRFAAATIEAY
ncbi:hypothetical protein VP1G_06963 [Cytospora mali]|uniref:Uncharacterized protein n=1 Tax=Cytospora mali TaxID=578113 RepID=A0A194V730_CYTMA|nr:hypothetical protein VP1G_06963 [Valsa mali var. pyri (nom. inval.)]